MHTNESVNVGSQGSTEEQPAAQAISVFNQLGPNAAFDHHEMADADIVSCSLLSAAKKDANADGSGATATLDSLVDAGRKNCRTAQGHVEQLVDAHAAKGTNPHQLATAEEEAAVSKPKQLPGTSRRPLQLMCARRTTWPSRRDACKDRGGSDGEGRSEAAVSVVEASALATGRQPPPDVCQGGQASTAKPTEVLAQIEVAAVAKDEAKQLVSAAEATALATESTIEVQQEVYIKTNTTTEEVLLAVVDNAVDPDTCEWVAPEMTAHFPSSLIQFISAEAWLS